MTYCNNKPIAILLAVYNGEKYLSQQLDSLLAQTNQDWTLYIRNDASTDGTEQIIDNYCQTHPDKIVEIDKGGANLGCSGNFFRLLEVVESDYYMFCDADDVWLPEKVEVSFDEIKRLEREFPGKPVLAYSDFSVCDEKLNMIIPSYWDAVGIDPYKYNTYNYIAIKCVVGGSMTIFNRLIKDLIIPWEDNGLIYDYWLALTAAKHGIISPIRKPLKLYRQHSLQVCGLTIKGRYLSGKAKSICSKIKRIHGIVKKLRKTGYGHPVKFYWYKIKDKFR